MWEGIFVPFATIIIAELFDKSQLSLILLSTRTKNHLLLFFGALAAFIVVDGLAILAGSYVTTLLPSSVLKIISGGIFILFGVITLWRQQDRIKEKKSAVSNAFFMSFTVVFLSEWGDKTQLAAGLLATQHTPYLVFIGVIGAFAVLSFLAIYIGNILERYTSRSLLSKLSGIIFIILGIFFLVF